MTENLQWLYLVNDDSWLTKFKEWETVRVIDSEVDENWEVNVYKVNNTPTYYNDDYDNCDCDCDNVHRNDNGNKVKYKLRFSRLRPLVYFESNVHQTEFDKLHIKKTFTDATIAKAEENYTALMAFVKAVSVFAKTMKNTASNVRTLANDLMTAVETHNDKLFNKTMANSATTLKFLKDDPSMKDLKAVMAMFDFNDDVEDEFNPIDLVG